LNKKKKSWIFKNKNPLTNNKSLLPSQDHLPLLMPKNWKIPILFKIMLLYQLLLKLHLRKLSKTSLLPMVLDNLANPQTMMVLDNLANPQTMMVLDNLANPQTMMVLDKTVLDNPNLYNKLLLMMASEPVKFLDNLLEKWLKVL